MDVAKLVHNVPFWLNGMEDAQGIDILVVPGGFGTRPLLEDEEMLGWVASTSSKAQLTVSVCSGALVLAKAGVLHGRRATTHWGALDLLASLDPTIMVERHARVVDDGVVTSAGVSAGIDMALCVVAKFHGDGVARETAHYIEYPWHAPEVAATASET